MANQFSWVTTGDEVVAHFADRVKGKTIAVTGPSAGGIGEATVLALAKGGPSILILLGRSPSKIQPVIDAVATIDGAIVCKLFTVDLASQASVRSAASALLADSSIPAIDILINNAGIMACPHEKTAEGIEMQFGANHIGHFLLTNLLVPKFAKGARVVNVASTGYAFGDPTFADVNFEMEPYNKWRAYGNGKVANLLFSVGLLARGITAVSVHPGWVESDLGRHVSMEHIVEALELGKVTPWFPKDLFGQQKKRENGCSTTLVGALDSTLTDAPYLFDCQRKEHSPESQSPENAERLWKLSEELIGQKFSY